MKVFTVSRYGVEQGALVTAASMPSGYKVPVISVGEEGRGRVKCDIPVRLQADTYRAWYEKGEVTVNYLDVVRTPLGYIRFEETSAARLHDEYIIVFLGWIGFRGDNRLELADGRPLPEDMVLGRGRIAQGEAGRMGSGEQWVLLVHHGDLLRYFVGGRLYGEPNQFMLVCAENKPLLYSADVYKVAVAYDE